MCFFFWVFFFFFFSNCLSNELYVVTDIYTVRSTRFFLNRRLVTKTHTFFIQNNLHWHIYRLLRSRWVSEKLPKIPLVEAYLINQLRLLGSQQHPQSRVPLTSLSTWEQKIDWRRYIWRVRGVIKGCNIFLGKKLANTCSFVGERIIVQQVKVSTAERSWTNTVNAFQEAIHYAFIKLCIYSVSLR